MDDDLAKLWQSDTRSSTHWPICMTPTPLNGASLSSIVRPRGVRCTLKAHRPLAAQPSPAPLIRAGSMPLMPSSVRDLEMDQNAILFLHVNKTKSAWS